VIVPTVNAKTVTPHNEALRTVVRHLTVSPPALATDEEAGADQITNGEQIFGERNEDIF